MAITFNPAMIVPDVLFEVDSMLLFVGNKNIFEEGGISVFRYNQEDGSLQLLGTQHLNVSAGSMCVDEVNARLFCVNERLECDGIPGGQVLSFQIDRKSGRLSLISVANTGTTLPCYLRYISETQQLFVCNHAKRGWTLHIQSAFDGTVCGSKEYDDAALEVFDVLPDGTVNGPSACWLAPLAGDSEDNPHLHCVIYDKDNQCSYVCDTGSNRIYSVAHHEGSVLEAVYTVVPDTALCAPRHGVFHPRLPIVYVNSEKQNALFVFKALEKKLIPLQIVPVVGNFPTGKPLGQSAIAVNREGSALYTLIRETRSISAFYVSENGLLRQTQSYPLDVESPRDLIILPDERYMLVACSEGRTLIRLRIGKNGLLSEHTLISGDLSCPSSLAYCRSDL